MEDKVRQMRRNALIEMLVGMRKSASMTEEELAAALGREPDFIASVERGEKNIDLLDFIELGRVLGFNTGAKLILIELIEADMTGTPGPPPVGRAPASRNDVAASIPNARHPRACPPNTRHPRACPGDLLASPHGVVGAPQIPPRHFLMEVLATLTLVIPGPVPGTSLR